MNGHKILTLHCLSVYSIMNVYNHDISILVSPWSLTVNWTGSPSSAVRLGTSPSTNIGGWRYESVPGFVSNTHNSVEHLVTPESHLATHVYTPVSADSKFDIESLAAKSSRDEVTLSSGLTSTSFLYKIYRDDIYFKGEEVV